MSQEIHLSVKKIKELGFAIDESVLLNFNPLETSLTLEPAITFPDENTIDINLTVKFTIQKDSIDVIVLSIKTVNSFYFKELSNYKNNDKYNIPEDVFATLLGLSITHTRALLSKNTQGTMFCDLYIPIVNPTLLAKQMVFTKDI